VRADVGTAVGLRTQPIATRARLAVETSDADRRIEEWIVGTLGDDGKPSADDDLQDLIGRFAPSRHGLRSRCAGKSKSVEQGGWARFRLHRRRRITVVTLTDKTLIKEPELGQMAGDLLALVKAGHHRIVLNFAGVERLSSLAVGAVAEALARCEAARGGGLKVCGLRSQVAAVFTIAGLARAPMIYPDETSAGDGAWPEPPALKPLPIDVLKVLTHEAGFRTLRPAAAERLQGGPELRLVPGPVERTSTEGIPPMPRAWLVAQVGTRKGRPIPLPGPSFAIGRSADCQLRPRSLAVSRRHAVIEMRQGAIHLRDLESTNGTLLNGRVLRGAERALVHGDQIQIGPLIFTLALGVCPAALPEVDDEVATWLRPEDDPVFGSAGEAPTSDAIEIDEALEGALPLKHEVIEDVLVVTPLAADLDGDAVVDGLRGGLLSLMERSVPRCVVVNLSNVDHISGRAVGVLVAHHLKLDRLGGALRICQANPRVAAVLEQVRLDMLVDCHPTVDDAVLSMWPEQSQDGDRSAM
jgi:anti-anti-sigma factor